MGETLYCSFVTLPSVAIADSEKGKKIEEEEEEEEEEEDEEEDQEEPEHRRTKKKKLDTLFFFNTRPGKTLPKFNNLFFIDRLRKSLRRFLKTALFT